MKAGTILGIIVVAILMIGLGLTLISGEQQGEDSASSIAARQSSVDESNVGAVPTPNARLSAPFAQTSLPTTERIASLGADPSVAAMGSLHSEVANRFANYLASLAGSADRIAELRSHLTAAYADILAFGVAIEQGLISEEEAAARADANYVLNQMAAHLTPIELTALETFMEDEARERFQSSYAPQLEVVGVELGSEDRRNLLETFFMETYLLVNANGLGAASSLASGFQRQIEAIENTRIALGASMTAEQFQQAQKFLDEQERGLQGALTIFGAN